MNINPVRARTAIARTAAVTVAAGAVATSMWAAASASAAPQDDLWNLVNTKHVNAGCAPYGGSQALADTAVDIAKTLANPPGGIAGNGRVPTDGMLSDRGYFVTSWAEADYVNTNGRGSAQDAMNFWLNNPTRDIFPNCGMRDMASAVWIQNGRWTAVVLTGTPGGAPPPPPEVIH